MSAAADQTRSLGHMKAAGPMLPDVMDMVVEVLLSMLRIVISSCSQQSLNSQLGRQTDYVREERGRERGREREGVCVCVSMTGGAGGDVDFVGPLIRPPQLEYIHIGILHFLNRLRTYCVVHAKPSYLINQIRSTVAEIVLACREDPHTNAVPFI